MRASLLPFVALALLFPPMPSLAQDGTGAAVAAGRPAAALRVIPRAPSLAESIEDPVTLLRLAGQTLGSGRVAEALDLLERAEARLLTRSELASQADRPEQGGAIGDIAAARAALAARDRPTAAFRIDQALAWLDRSPAPLPAAAIDPPSSYAAPLAQRPMPLSGIAPQDMPVGGTASPPVPFGPDIEYPRAPSGPGDIPPSSSKAPG